MELLAACCEKASEGELERVRNACFLLGDAVCWEMKRPTWLALEFELLRQAALVAQRPGHLLLIQTLERACRGMAGRVEPYLDSFVLYRWTQCAMEALCSKDVKELRCRLPALLQASDERVLHELAPGCEAYGVASFMGAQRQLAEVEAESLLTVAQGPEVSESAEALPTTSQALTASERAEAPLASTQAPEVAQSTPEPMPAPDPGALCASWSGLHTSLCEVPPGGRSSRACFCGASTHSQHRWARAALHGAGLLALARSWACAWACLSQRGAASAHLCTLHSGGRVLARSAIASRRCPGVQAHTPASPLGSAPSKNSVTEVLHEQLRAA